MDEYRTFRLASAIPWYLFIPLAIILLLLVVRLYRAERALLTRRMGRALTILRMLLPLLLLLMLLEPVLSIHWFDTEKGRWQRVDRIDGRKVRWVTLLQAVGDSLWVGFREGEGVADDKIVYGMGLYPGHYRPVATAVVLWAFCRALRRPHMGLLAAAVWLGWIL